MYEKIAEWTDSDGHLRTSAYRDRAEMTDHGQSDAFAPTETLTWSSR
jgi:hypothetical protein